MYGEWGSPTVGVRYNYPPTHADPPMEEREIGARERMGVWKGDERKKYGKRGGGRE